MTEHEDSAFLFKGPCDACGSSDGNAHYSNHTFCFVCSAHVFTDGSTSTHRGRPKLAADILYEGEFKALPARLITEETCRKFGYKTGLASGKKVQIAPYYRDGEIVGTKVRPQDKDKMFSSGDMGGKIELFGQHLWRTEGGRKIVITEGEIDCLTVCQVQKLTWPVVSIPKGAKGAKKALSDNMEFLLGFEEVILMFDMDEAGDAAKAECAPLFPPGRCKIARLSMKDPNELLLAGKGQEIISAIWEAKTYRPDGVVTVSDIRAKALTPPDMGLPWWTTELTKLTWGRRWGEIYGFGAGTGVGKTDWLTQQMMYDITELHQKVGIFALEQHPAETAKRLAGKMQGRRFHVPDNSWTTQELVNGLDALEGNAFFYDSFGATDWERIASTIRFLNHSEGVRIFYLDHLTALAAAEEDERKALEKIMAEMASLVKELNIILHMVSHLATPEGTPHEEGGRVMVRHFKGSRSIGFWCMFMFGLERNQQDADPVRRATTTFRCLKDRNTGQATGQVTYLGYDVETGCLFETVKPPDASKFGLKDETQHSPDEFAEQLKPDF